MARNPHGNTAAVAFKTTAAVAFLAHRRGAGADEISTIGTRVQILPTILPQSLALFC
jgi:hypothetical protein